MDPGPDREFEGFLDGLQVEEWATIFRPKRVEIARGGKPGV